MSRPPLTNSESQKVIHAKEDMQYTVHVSPCRLPSNAEGTRLATTDELPAGHQGWYGTRTSTVLLITRSTPARALLVERDTYAVPPQGEPVPLRLESCKEHERRYEWSLLQVGATNMENRHAAV